MMPWKLLTSSNIFIISWLIGYSGLLGPIAGIMIIDFWVIRKRKLVVLDLYREEGGIYKKFYAGPIVALLIGITPNLPGFIRF